MRIGLAVLLTGLVAGNAVADDLRDTVARKFGEAVSIAERCGRLKVAPERMAIYTLMLGIPLDEALRDAMMRHTIRATVEMSDREETIVCAVGRALFGPEGTSAPDILVEE